MKFLQVVQLKKINKKNKVVFGQRSMARINSEKSQKILDSVILQHLKYSKDKKKVGHLL